MKSLLKYFKGYGKECVLGPFFKLLEASFELFVPLIIAGIIDVGIDSRDKNYIFQKVMILAILGIVGLICSVSAQFFSAKAATSFAGKLREELFSHIQKLSYHEVDKVGTATLITRLTSDVNQLQSGVNMTLRLFLRSPFIVFGAMIMAFTISVKMAVIFLITILLLSIVVYGVMIITIPMHKKVQKGVDSILSRTRDNLMGVRVIRAFNMEDDERERFDEENNVLTQASLKVGRLSALTNPVTYIIINFAVIFLIYKGAVSVEIGGLSQGQVVALVNYMSQILVELIKLAGFIVLDIKALACASRISDVLGMKCTMEYGEDNHESDNNMGTFDIKSEKAESNHDDISIEFEDVSFTYEGGLEPAVSHISFAGRVGETIGIIGGTGSGKSTLVNLLMRNYDATEGTVRLCGKPIGKYTKDSLAKLFSLVPQKALLFGGSIRENIRYGKDDVSDDAIWNALDMACAKDFVKEKEGGLDYVLSAKGKNLSGGQRQRLTIARALVKNAPILLLDDSFSALDALTDRQLRDNLKTIKKDTLTVIISQRAASIKNADRIIVLDDGMIVGYGNHNELMKTCDIYREIYESQYSSNAGGDNNG